MGIQRHDRGVTLIETMLAVLMAFIVMASIGTAVFSAMVTNKNQGAETTRMTTMAQEKIEELIRLNFTDTTTNATLITDVGWNIGLTSNSLTDLNRLSTCPASGTADVGYLDFLDNNGLPIQGTCASAVASSYGYERRWKIQDVSGITGLKQITVVAYSLNAVNAGGGTPSVSLTSFKSQ